MALTKTVDGMAYELAGSKKVDGKRASVKIAEQLSTPRLLFIIVKRHRVGLLAVGNIILLLNWAFPLWFTFALSLFK